jgi:flagellar biosynthetic protein FliP
MRKDAHVLANRKSFGVALIAYIVSLLLPVVVSAQEIQGNVPTNGSSPTEFTAPPIPAAQNLPNTPSMPTAAPFSGLGEKLPNISSPENFSSAMQIIILLTVLSLAPALLIMMTSFTRIIIVLSLLRQALGTQQLPPNQILIGLAMFMTFIVMSPTWKAINDTALQPYMNGQMSQQVALQEAQKPLRAFMIAQIEFRKNYEDVLVFTDPTNQPIKSFQDVSTMQLIPGFMLSELKTAFLMGFTVYLPFLIVDMVISSILISMGMMMLPPVLISLPFKLLLFVLVDGWRLITGNLMGSFVGS